MPEFRIEPIIQTVTNGIKDGKSKSAKKQKRVNNIKGSDIFTSFL